MRKINIVLKLTAFESIVVNEALDNYRAMLWDKGERFDKLNAAIEIRRRINEHDMQELIKEGLK